MLRNRLLFIYQFGISLIFGFDSTYREGIILGVISSILAALFTLFNENFVKKHTSLLKITTFQMIGGTLGLSVIILLSMSFSDFQFIIPTGMNFNYLLILALLCTVVMYILLNRALREISSFTIKLNFNLEPIYGIILAFIIFDESENFNVPFIKNALGYNPKLKLWASQWSPPTWMKYNKHYAAISVLGDSDIQS